MKPTPLRVAGLVGALVVIMMIPAIGVVLLGWSSAGLLACIAALGGLFSGLGLRLKGLLLLSVASAIGVFLATFIADNPLAAATLMAIAGLTYGYANSRGLAAANFIFPMLIATVLGKPPTITNVVPLDALITAGVTIGSILIAGFIVMLVWKTPIDMNKPPAPRKNNIIYTVNMTVLLGLAGYLTSLWHAQVPGGWFAITVVVIIQPHAKAAMTRGIERGAGTILGFLLAIGVATAVKPDFLYYLVGLVFVEIAVLLRFNKDRPYWQYVMFVTPGIVLLSGLPSQVTQFADWRLLANVIAAVICLAVLGLERVIFWRGEETIDAQPFTASETEAKPATNP